jgi:fucose 4-O-acetylase-like acetyltransferase
MLEQRLYDPVTIAARTPADRDRTADLLRLVAILMVVLGHWLVATVLYDDDQLVVGQVLQHVPETRALTWVFQVMPLFFFVGGYVNAGSWERFATGELRWPVWVRRRARRLLGPLVPVLLVWIAGPVVLAALGVEDRLIALAARYALLPLWFLVVYTLVVGLVPVTVALHRRFGVLVPVGAAALVVVVDALERAEVPVVGFANYLLVWGAIHQLGYFWHDGRLPRRPAVGVTVAAFAVAVTVVLVVVLDRPFSMVAHQGAEQHNTDPPNLVLLTYGLAQLSLVVAIRRPLARWLENPRVWAPVVLGGSATVTLFLWHMTALVIVGMGAHLSGLWPRFERIDATWWALRPVWLTLCALVLALLVAVFRRFERQGDPVEREGAWRVILGLVAFAAGMALIAMDGIYRPGAPLNLALLPIALALTGLASLGALRPRSLDPPSS